MGFKSQQQSVGMELAVAQAVLTPRPRARRSGDSGEGAAAEGGLVTSGEGHVGAGGGLAAQGSG